MDYKNYSNMNTFLALLIITLYTTRQSFIAKQTALRLFKYFIFKNPKRILDLRFEKKKR